jgi:oxygen-independent coproporphyrinogen-3 oxidase
LLRAELLRQLFLRLKAGFPWAEAEEVTFECAPRSISKEKVAILHEAGVDRLSLGVQQLDNDVLRLNGRFHLVDDVLRAWKLIRQREFAEVNVDLIVGLRGETEVSFFRSLEQVIGLGPDCITLYQLEIPRNTPLCGAIGDENVAAQLPDWETKRSRLARAFERLEREGYQVRNAYSAARGTRHPHFAYAEQQYHGADLIGLGLSSFSYVAGIHYQNTTSAEEYAAAVDASLLPIARSYRLDREEQMVRELVLQLKLGHVNRPYFRRKFGVDPLVRFARPIEACAERGWMQWSDGWIELTREGLVRADRLLPAFYLARHRGQPYW